LCPQQSDFITASHCEFFSLPLTADREIALAAELR
jgi:hypothetical protein